MHSCISLLLLTPASRIGISLKVSNPIGARFFAYGIVLRKKIVINVKRMMNN